MAMRPRPGAARLEPQHLRTRGVGMFTRSPSALRRILLSTAVIGALLVNQGASAREGAPANGVSVSVSVSNAAPAPSASSATSASGGTFNGQVSSLTYNVDPPVKSATRAAETALSVCSEDDPRCIADALDAYADALRQLPLPPQLRNLPDVVSRVAHQVRAARTRTQAIAAIKIAIAEVHRTITLLRADDAIVLKAETRESAFVAETLAVADEKLEKAGGL